MRAGLCLLVRRRERVAETGGRACAPEPWRVRGGMHCDPAGPTDLIDRLADHVHLRPTGEPCSQNLADLLRAPLPVQTILDEAGSSEFWPILPCLGRHRRWRGLGSVLQVGPQEESACTGCYCG